MFIAYDADKNRVDIREAIKNNIKCYCPSCGEELKIKNGSIILPHFAHKTGTDCDTFSHDMSKWHLDWQEKFPKETREIVIEQSVREDEYRWVALHCVGAGLDDYNDFCNREANGKLLTYNIKHRADICINNYIIEFQHSPLGVAEFLDRNWFYKRAGYKIIWVIDVEDQWINGNLEFLKLRDDYRVLYSWKYAKKYLENVVPQKDKDILIFLDSGYCKDGYNTIFKVDWAQPDKSDKSCVSYKRFIIHNVEKDKQFIKLIKEGKL